MGLITEGPQESDWHGAWAGHGLGAGGGRRPGLSCSRTSTCNHKLHFKPCSLSDLSVIIKQDRLYFSSRASELLFPGNILQNLQ